MVKILFVVGPHASGKTYSTSAYLQNKKSDNTIIIDTGPIMRNIHKNSNSNIHISEWVKMIEQKYGKNITSSLITGEINKLIVQGYNDNAVLIGFRTIDSILYLIDNLKIEDYRILYLDATFELLYSNYLQRERNGISKMEFDRYLNDELASGLITLKDLCMSGEPNCDYFYKRSNEDSFEEYMVNFFSIEKCKQLVKK